MLDLKDKTVKTTTLPTDMFENRKLESGLSVSKTNDKNPDRFAFKSTPSIRDRSLPIEENITTRRPHGRATLTTAKVVKFDGTTSWLDFKTHFDVCA